MQLVICHYHLNRGGVTSVVANHLRSLALLKPAEAPTRVVIVYGGRAAAWDTTIEQELPFECSLMALPELEYDSLSDSRGNHLYDALQPVLQQLDPATTVLHIHNHSLGKNASMAPVVGQLAAAGWRLLLQIHDFAEDLRPGNYQHLLAGTETPEMLRRQLYPQAEQIQYAVLNRRDRQVLSQAGVPNERLRLLPNPVLSVDSLPTAEQHQELQTKLLQDLGLPTENRVVLYPVRPIRRKNLGEFLLWSLLCKDTTFALTLAPLNPQEKVSYDRWIAFARELDLPVQFEVAEKTSLSFPEIYQASNTIITTSVAEGFGMVYLEASLAGKPLVGRNLPGVCGDFLDAGMQFPGLAERFAIPTDQLDVDELHSRSVRTAEGLRAAYGLPPSDSSRGVEVSTFSGDTIDFGRLESEQQRAFLRRLKTEAALRRELCQQNPQLQQIDSLEPEVFQQTLKNNRQVIADSYSPAIIGKQLSEIYQSLLASQPGRVDYERSIAGAVLDYFLDPSQLFPIRLES